MKTTVSPGTSLVVRPNASESGLDTVERDTTLGSAAVRGAEEFYFAVLDVSDLPASLRRGRSAAARATLDARLERFVPVRVEHLATAYAQIDESTVAACAIEDERLATISPEATALFPATLPEGLGGAVACQSLNVLIGEREPVPVRDVRRRIHLAASLGICVLLVLAWIGLERRASVLDQRAAGAIRRTIQLASPLGEHATAGQAVDALRAERERLEFTRGASASQSLPRDAATELSRLLSLWPESIDVRTDRIEVGPDRSSVAVRLGSKADLEALVGALSKREGYTIEVGRVETMADGIRVTIVLQRSASAAGEGGVP